ncbi:DUF885 domain-containing protein [Telmatobacter sp. DSM 110680]|uniref:DUF885 domain-containing protein n=1 Tax=Telmatobacter sp. DSM 110680 TaxID=3036704 RepID=A0AAU7DRG5_9BACT
MKRISSFAFAMLLACSCCVFAQLSPAVNAPTNPEDRTKALHTLFHDYWESVLKNQPEFASSIGDKRYNDQVSDFSVKAINEWLATEQEYLMKLAAIDPTGLSDQDKTSRELLMRDIADDQEGAEFKEWEMPVNQMGGIYSIYPQLVAEFSFTTVKDYDDWIARLHKIPEAFEQVTAEMSIGIDDKRVPPKFLLEKALEQVKQLAAQKPEDSPLALPLKKFPASISAEEQARIKTEMLAAITKEVQPAYNRFARFLEVAYIPAGRAEPGISALPDGAKYYNFLIRRTTTTKFTADQIHQIGLEEVKKDEAEMLTIAQKLGFKDLASFRASLKANPKNKPSSAEALLAVYRGYLTPMQARLPQLFGRLPKTSFEVVPVPDYIEKTAATAYYQSGTPDGSRPGRLFINTHNHSDRNLDEVEAIAYHEGLPGHHMQLSIGQELTGFPEFRKFEGYTAFVEGWGLYAERLGKDVGLYQDPYSDYGRVEGDILRAVRLVVDTGVHSKHWTRQQMVDYFHDHSAIDETDVQVEVDRYIAWPSQALAYKIGQLKILELRDRAKKELGSKFDIRTFHDQVIDSGALPLDVLEERITNWIATQKSTGK